MPLKFLALCVVLAPMTGARFAERIGPAEILAALWCLVIALRFRPIHFERRDFLFWWIFLASLSLGTLVGSLVTPHETAPLGILVWVFLGGVSLMVGGAVQRHWSSDEIEKTLRWLTIVSVVYYSALYLYSVLVSQSLLGVSLWAYGVRYTGGGDNPHQLALLLTFTISWSLREIIRGTSITRRLLYGAVLIAAAFLGLETQATTLLAALGVGLLVAAAVVARQVLGSRAAVAAILLIGAVAVGAVPRLQELMIAFIESDENGWGRIRLWSDFSDVMLQSGFLGLGPGAHARGGEAEFHNSLLDLAAISGVIGVGAFVIYMGFALKRMWVADPTLLIVASSLLAYGVAGFSVRRIVFWVIFMLLLGLLSQRNELRAGNADRATAPTRSVRDQPAHARPTRP